MIDLRQLVTTNTAASTGTLTLAAFEQMFVSLREMYQNARAEPDLLYVSPYMVKRMRHLERVGTLYRARLGPYRSRGDAAAAQARCGALCGTAKLVED